MSSVTAHRGAFALPALPSARAIDPAMAGIALVVASTLFFALGDVAAKGLTGHLPALEVAWIRYAFFSMLVIPAALALRGRAAFSVARPGLQAVRGTATALSAVLFMVALSHLLVAEATAINFVSPIFITALSIPLLGEKVGKRRWAAALVGFGGVMLVVQPGAGSFQAAAFWPVASALVWAVAAVTTRMMSGDHPASTLAWSAVVGMGLLTLAVPSVWVAPSWSDVGIGAVMGLSSTLGHLLLVLGFRKASASVLAPFSYVQLLFAAALGFLAFGSVPGYWTVVGGCVIAASGLYTAHRERVRAKGGIAAPVLAELASTAGGAAVSR
jgi:drug/metabolite transporter (DMT)-like permease